MWIVLVPSMSVVPSLLTFVSQVFGSIPNWLNPLDEPFAWFCFAAFA